MTTITKPRKSNVFIRWPIAASALLSLIISMTILDYWPILLPYVAMGKQNRAMDIPDTLGDTSSSASHSSTTTTTSAATALASATRAAPTRPLAELTTSEHAQRQIAWVRSHGGFVHSGYEIRRANPQDPTSRYGAFAKSNFAKDELILSIPRVCLITPSTDPNEKDDDVCATVRILAREMKSVNASFFEPYVSYLQTQTKGPQLPTLWSDEGKELLLQVVGWDSSTGQSKLPPRRLVNAGLSCEEHGDYERKAQLLVTQRSWDEILIPVWDMVSHRNSGFHPQSTAWMNVAEAHSVHNENYPVTVRAVRDITAGEEFFMSYDRCPDCGGRSKTYGTPEILRDYGFVELWPQKWVFHNQDVSISLDSLNDDDDDDDLVLKWHSERPTVKALHFFKNQITRLSQMDLTKNKATQYSTIPRLEWDIIVRYHAALIRAMKYVVGKQK